MSAENPMKQTRGRSFLYYWVIWFILIGAAKWQSLSDPPMWDAAIGLFPAAGVLADTGFDLRALLQQSTAWQGGPNAHADSLITWLTAVVLYVVGKGPAAFAVLHLLHFTAAAWTLAVLHQFADEHLGRIEAWAICVAIFTCPLFSAQAGAMYFEIPLAACTVSAVVAYANNKVGRALVWSVLAVLVKQAGVLVPAVLIVAILLRHDPLAKRLLLATAFALCGGLAAGWPLIGTPLLHAATVQTRYATWWDFMSKRHMAYLRAIPDIVAAFGLMAVAGMFCLASVWRSLRSMGALVVSNDTTSPSLSNSDPVNSALTTPVPSQDRSWVLLSLAWLLVLAFAGFFFVVPYVGKLDVYCLPRYFVFILPPLVFGLTLVVASWTSRRAAVTCLALASMWFVTNRTGAMYPQGQTNNGSIAERTDSCRWLVEAQRTMTKAASHLPDDSLVLYGLPEHFFFRYPWMGYADRRHPSGRCVALAAERPESLKVQDLPDRFYVIQDTVIMGGLRLEAILREASEDPTRRVRKIDQFVHEPYRVCLYEVTRVEQATTADSR